MRFTRFKTESDHEELDKLVAAYLDRGGVIHRGRDSRITVVCRACGLRKRVDGIIPRIGIRCRCGYAAGGGLVNRRSRLWPARPTSLGPGPISVAAREKPPPTF
jgi:hypothetical protein